MSLLENIQRWVAALHVLDEPLEKLKQVSFSFTSLEIHINESNSFKFDLTCENTNQSATIQFDYYNEYTYNTEQTNARSPTLLDVFCLYIGFKLIISNPRIHSLTKWICFLLYRSVSLPEEIGLRVFDSIEIEKLLKSVSPWSGDITIVVENLLSLYSSFISNYQRHFISLLAASGFFSLFPYERTGFKTFWSALNSGSLDSSETTKFIICRNVESLHTVLLYDNLCPELDFSDCSDPETVKIIMESIGTSEVNIPFDFGNNNQHSEVTSAFKKKKIWSLLSKHVDIYESYPPFFELELHEKLNFLRGFVSDSKISDHNVRISLNIASEGSDEAVMKAIWSNTRRPVDLFINDDESVDIDLFKFIPVFETFDFFHLSDSIVGNIIEKFMERPGYHNYININRVWSCLRCKVAAHRIVLHNHEVRDFFRSSFSDDDQALHIDPFYSEDVHPEQQELKDIYQREYDRIIASESEISQINETLSKTKLYRHEKKNKFDFLIFFVNQLIDFTSKDPLMQIVINIVFQGYPPLDDFSHFPDVRFQNFMLNIYKQIHKDDFIFRFCFILFSFIPFSHVKNSIKIFLGLDSDRHMLIQKIQRDYWYLFFNTWSNISSPLIDCLEFKSPYLTILSSSFWDPSYITPVVQPVLFKILWYTTCNPSNLLQRCWDTVLQVYDPVYLFYGGSSKLSPLHLVLYLEASSAKYVQHLSRESCTRILSDLCSFSTYEHVKRWWESISTLFNPILFSYKNNLSNVDFVKCFVPKNFESLDKQLCIDIFKSVKHKYYVEMSKDSVLNIVESFTSDDTWFKDLFDRYLPDTEDKKVDIHNQKNRMSVIHSFVAEHFELNWDIKLLEKLFHSFLNSNHEMVDSIKFDKTHISYWAFSLIFLENPNTQFFKKQSSTLFSNPSKHIKITQFSDFISSYFDNSDDFTSLSGIKNAMLKFEEEHCFMPIIQNQMGLFNMRVINNLQSMKIVIDKQNFAEFLKFLVNQVMLFEEDISNLWNSFKHNKYYMEIMCENEEIFNLFASNLQLQDCSHLDIKQCSKLLGFGVSLNDSDRSALWQLLPFNVDAIIKCDGENKEDVFKKFAPLLKAADCMHLEKADCLDLLTMGSKINNFNHSMLWHVLPSPLKAIFNEKNICNEYLKYITLTYCADLDVEQCVIPYNDMLTVTECMNLEVEDCYDIHSMLFEWRDFYHLFLTFVPIINRSHLVDLSDEDLITVCENILKFSVEHPNSISESLWNDMNDCVKLVKFLEFDSYMANKHLIRPNDYDTLENIDIVKILKFELNEEEDMKRWNYISHNRNPLKSILNVAMKLSGDEQKMLLSLNKTKNFVSTNFHKLSPDEEKLLTQYFASLTAFQRKNVYNKLKEISADIRFLASSTTNLQTRIIAYADCHPDSRTYDMISAHSKQFCQRQTGTDSSPYYNSSQSIENQFIVNNNSAIGFYESSSRKQFNHKDSFALLSVLHTILFFICVSLIYSFIVLSTKSTVKTDLFLHSEDFFKNGEYDGCVYISKFCLLSLELFLSCTIVFGLFSKHQTESKGVLKSAYFFFFACSSVVLFFNYFFGIHTFYALITLVLCFWSPELSLSWFIFSIAPLLYWTKWWKEVNALLTVWLVGQLVFDTLLGKYKGYASSLAGFIICISSFVTAKWELEMSVYVFLLYFAILFTLVFIQVIIVDVLYNRESCSEKNCQLQVIIDGQYENVEIEKHHLLHFPENHNHYYTFINGEYKRFWFWFPFLQAFGHPNMIKTKSQSMVTFRECLDDCQPSKEKKYLIKPTDCDIFGINALMNTLPPAYDGDFEFHIVLFSHKNDIPKIKNRLQNAIHWFSLNFSIERTYTRVPKNRNQVDTTTYLLHNETYGVIPLFITIYNFDYDENANFSVLEIEVEDSCYPVSDEDIESVIQDVVVHVVDDCDMNIVDLANSILDESNDETVLK
ncbi:hypothetical protein PCE1_002666 [Barthelona sp. PCE]